MVYRCIINIRSLKGASIFMTENINNSEKAQIFVFYKAWDVLWDRSFKPVHISVIMREHKMCLDCRIRIKLSCGSSS